jgi:hypothetical protein
MDRLAGPLLACARVGSFRLAANGFNTKLWNMKNFAFLVLCPALMLQGCHPDAQLKSPDKQRIKTLELAHAKENAERDKLATEQQLEVMRSYAAKGDNAASSQGNTASTNRRH